MYTKVQHSFTPIVFNTDNNLSSVSFLPISNKSSHCETIIYLNKLYILCIRKEVENCWNHFTHAQNVLFNGYAFILNDRFQIRQVVFYLQDFFQLFLIFNDYYIRFAVCCTILARFRRICRINSCSKSTKKKRTTSYFKRKNKNTRVIKKYYINMQGMLEKDQILMGSSKRKKFL